MSTQKDLPISAAQIAEMVQDSSEQLLATLGLRVKIVNVASDSRRARGIKARVYRGVSWPERCKMWRKGARKKKDPTTGAFLYAHTETPITLRWENDMAYRNSCNQMSQIYFGTDFDHAMALEADRLGWEEMQAAQERGYTHALPSDRRQELFPEQPAIRSQQSGGSNTRPRANTTEERRAIAAIKGKG